MNSSAPSARPSAPRLRQPVTAGDADGWAIRTYPQIADELFRRTGERLSAVRIQQICARAEGKLARQLAREGGGQ